MQQTSAYPSSEEKISVNTSDSRRVGILLQLHSEYIRCCFAITIVGSLANALSGPLHPKIDTRTLVDYLPSRPLLGPELARDLLEKGAGPEICRAAFSVGNQLQLCCDLTSAFSKSVTKSPAALEPLTDAWRRLANACYVLEYMVDCALAESNAAAIKPSRVVFGPLLKQIGSGKHPCVDLQGVVSLPGWAERRSASRVSHIGIPAMVTDGDSTQRVEIVNLSSTGAGLLGISGLEEGHRLTLRVGPKMAFECTVRWSDDHRGGIAFREPLHQLDLQAIQSSFDQARLDNDGTAARSVHAKETRSWETPLEDLVELPGSYSRSSEH